MSGGQEPEALDELLALADELLVEATAVREQWADLARSLGGEDAEVVEPPAEDVRRLLALDMMLSGRPVQEARDHMISVFGDDVDQRVIDEVYNSLLEG